jgi:hypothetical protein
VIGDGMVPVPRDDPDYDELSGIGRETPTKNERFRNSRMTAEDIERVREILSTVKLLAAEYYRLTGKPLGVTGEVAEYVAADKLGLVLTDPRNPGYDAIRRTPHGDEHIQIKGRAYGKGANAGRISRIKTDSKCNAVLLVLLDNTTLEPREMFEAPFEKVKERLAIPGKAHERGALGVSEFKSIAQRVWPVAKLPS